MIYGPPGAGKTCLACQSQTQRTFLFDVDRGALGALCFRGVPEQNIPGVNADLVDVWECTSFADVLAGYSWLVTQARYKKYGVIALDTATELQRLAVSELCKRQGIEVASQREWGIALSMMDDLTRAFKDLNRNIIFTAHEGMLWDEYEGGNMYKPLFQGQYRDRYAGHFSEIWRYHLINKERADESGKKVRVVARALQCQKDQFSHAKNRSGALGKWEPPVLDPILEKIYQRVMSAAQPQNGDTSAQSSTATGGRPEPGISTAGPAPGSVLVGAAGGQ
jgi:hypothetical protein